MPNNYTLPVLEEEPPDHDPWPLWGLLVVAAGIVLAGVLIGFGFRAGWAAWEAVW